MKSEENIALIKQELSDFKIDLGSIKELLDVKVTTAKKLTVDEYQSISAILTEKLGRDIFLNKMLILLFSVVSSFKLATKYMMLPHFVN